MENHDVLVTSIMPTLTEESKNSEVPRDDLLAVFSSTKEPMHELRKPIVVRVTGGNNHHEKHKKGIYYVS